MIRMAAFLALLLCTGACTPEAEDQLSEAQTLASEGRHEAALEQVQDLLVRTADVPESTGLRAQALELAGRLSEVFLDDPQDALAYYGALAEAVPGTPEALEARERMARIYLDRLDDPAGAITHWEVLASATPPPPHADRYRYEVLRAYFRLGEHAQVRAEANTLLSTWPDSEWADDARFLLGISLQMSGVWDEAMHAFEAVWTEHPRSELAARARVEAGACLVELGRDQEALETWQTALVLHPDPRLVERRIHRLEARLAKRQKRAQHVLAR